MLLVCALRLLLRERAKSSDSALPRTRPSTADLVRNMKQTFAPLYYIHIFNSMTQTVHHIVALFFLGHESSVSFILVSRCG